MKTLLKRMVGAARFDAETYENIEADAAATAGAIVVVFVASIAAAISSAQRTLWISAV
jgi:hypothetical protein